ncbi:hypothetical protein TRFO_16039 [Tritrichomonas foetus]|uniref:t-SNARE coiled-coil homology domain-containing protein n=1 Tax=Tritrichomonas foetus TaxID=1144522 RepID=A0A1J4KR32_9EUKA|nr:hypothetical protein TRFO_16039 [Tritrichomonas foetus]|eukprot:OHT13719.1 hypothetical protein TRFO_16039 [Tritrichomonas foetus]
MLNKNKLAVRDRTRDLSEIRRKHGYSTDLVDDNQTDVFKRFKDNQIDESFNQIEFKIKNFVQNTYQAIDRAEFILSDEILANVVELFKSLTDLNNKLTSLHTIVPINDNDDNSVKVHKNLLNNYVMGKEYKYLELCLRCREVIKIGYDKQNSSQLQSLSQLGSDSISIDFNAQDFMQESLTFEEREMQNILQQINNMTPMSTQILDMILQQEQQVNRIDQDMSMGLDFMLEGKTILESVRDDKNNCCSRASNFIFRWINIILLFFIFIFGIVCMIKKAHRK